MNPDPSKANKIVYFTNAQKAEYQTLVTGKLMTQKIKRLLVDFLTAFCTKGLAIKQIKFKETLMFILLHIEASSFILLTKVNYILVVKCRCLGNK